MTRYTVQNEASVMNKKARATALALMFVFTGITTAQEVPVKTMRLAQTMADKAPVWERIVAKHALQPTPYTEAALWPYGDFVFMPEYDIMSDTLKLRRAGFNECMDTEEMFLRLLTRMREARALP